MVLALQHQKHTTTEAKTETAVKEDVKKADTAAEKMHPK